MSSHPGQKSDVGGGNLDDAKFAQLALVVSCLFRGGLEEDILYLGLKAIKAAVQRLGGILRRGNKVVKLVIGRCDGVNPLPFPSIGFHPPLPGHVLVVPRPSTRGRGSFGRRL